LILANFHIEQDKKFGGIYWAFDPSGKRFLATKNLVKGFRVSDERVITVSGEEYRFWEPSRSKLAAAIVKGLRNLPISPGSSVLYLGAANGITSSFVSDVIGKKGVLYGVEISASAMEDFIFVCQKRENMLPILSDARAPEKYSEMVESKVDVVFEDVADKEQANVMIRNARACLKKGGYGMLAVKARCIDSAADPKKIFAQVEKELADDFEIEENLDIDQFEKDHEFLLLKFKG